MPRLIPPALGNGWRPGDERHGSGSVPVLDVSDASHDLVGQAQSVDIMLTGAVLQFDHVEGPATVHIGGSTLYEAATEVVNCVHQLGSDVPKWVASTDGDLAAIVAEHFTTDLEAEDGKMVRYSSCKVIDLDEVKA